MNFKTLTFCLNVLLFVPCLLGMENINIENLLDKTFGNNGTVTTDFGKNSGTYNRMGATIHLKIQPDSKIIIVGDSYLNHNFEQPRMGAINHPESSVALARYNSDGSLDSSFGNDGKVILPISKVDSFGIDLALQDDEKIVIVVRSFDRGDNYPDGVLVRLNQDGSLDSSFGRNGVVMDNNEEYGATQFWRMAIQIDGKIVCCGVRGKDDPKYVAESRSILVVRYNNDGTPDLSFGEDGKVETFLEAGNLKSRKKFIDYANGLALQLDGKILVATGSDYGVELDDLGYYKDARTQSALIRYGSTGKLDESFGKDNNGIAANIFERSSNLVDVAVQPDGKIIAVGFARNPSTDKDEFLVARYLSDGNLDESFGENKNGIALTTVGTDHAQVKNVLLQVDGKILVTGYVKWGDHSKFTVVRYTQEGLLDTTFGENGILVTSIGDYDDKSYAMALQDDGKLVVVGNSFDGKKYNFALVRYDLSKFDK